jgi:Aspartyl protease
MGFAARVGLLCVLAPLAFGAAPQASAPTLPAFLAQMRAASGDVYSAHFTGTLPQVVDGRETTLDTEMQGLKFELRQCTGQACVATYFDGERLFSVNINGTALPRSPAPDAYLRALRLIDSEQFLAPGFVANGGKLVDGGYTSFQGRRCRKLYVSDAIATPMAVFVDAQTALVAGARDVNGNATYVMRDYRRAGNYELPFQIDRNGTPLERYTARAPASGSLDAPRGLKPVFEESPAGMPIDPQSPTPVGICSIGGVSARCLIDTGNSSLSMSVELAERLGLKPVGMLRVAGLGNYATEVVRAGPLQLGNVRFGDANYIVLSDIQRYGYDIVLGADILASAAVTIDYTRHALFFGGLTDADKGGVTVPLLFQNFVPVVSVTLGDLPTQLAVDTGDESNINLAYEYYQRHTELFEPTSTTNVSGIGGQSVEILGRIPSVRIGNITAKDQEIGTTRTLKGTADGHLGARFLSNYRVVFDYAHSRLRLVPKTQ